MPISSFIPNTSNIDYVLMNDELDEFFRQLLAKCLSTPDTILGGSDTKPIFKNNKLIMVGEDTMFLNMDNNNMELLVSFDRDNSYYIKENECTNPVEIVYIIYVRLPITPNNRNRLTRVLDRLIWLLTKNNLTGNNGYITSIINTDPNNLDNNLGRKYYTNLNLVNRIAPGSRFEVTETINNRNYYTGGFSVFMTFGWK